MARAVLFSNLNGCAISEGRKEKFLCAVGRIDNFEPLHSTTEARGCFLRNAHNHIDFNVSVTSPTWCPRLRCATFR